MPIEISRSNVESDVILAINGSLDAITAPEIRVVVDELVDEKQSSILVDLAGLDLIDSSGVAVLVALYKRIRALGGTVKVVNARDQPLAIFKLLRMDRVFSI